MATPGKAYIPMGTSSKCSKGTSENCLNLPIDHGVAYAPELKPLMNANDHIPGEHILKYGFCKAKKSFCSPVTPLAWTKVNKQHILDGAPALLDESLLTCVFGGVISIVPSEKGSVEDGEKNEGAEDKVESIASAEETQNKGASPLSNLSKEQMKELMDSQRDKAVPMAEALYEEYGEDFRKGVIDVVYFDIAPAEKLAGFSYRGSVDKYGQVYMTVSGYLGAGVGLGGVGVSKLLANGDNNMKKSDMAKYITGLSGGVAAVGGIGGGISIGEKGGTVDLMAGLNAYINANISWTEKVHDLDRAENE